MICVVDGDVLAFDGDALAFGSCVAPEEFGTFCGVVCVGSAGFVV